MIPRVSRKLPILLFVSALVDLPAAALLAQQHENKVVKSEAGLPRFNYPISGTATQLVTSDDATFNAFVAKVRADVDSVLNNYDIEDHATLRDLLGVRLNLEILSGQNREALATLDKLRAVQTSPTRRC